MKLERDLEEYNPWGKAGGGAPLKDRTGRLVCKYTLSEFAYFIL